MEACTVCDHCRAPAKVHLTLIPSMGVLTLCRHCSRPVTSALEAMGGEFEVVEEDSLAMSNR